MGRIYEERSSDSPYVEKIGHFCIEGAYSQLCAADVFWNFMVVKHLGKTVFTVWGPETKAALMTFPVGAEFLFIRFKLGGFMPKLPVNHLVDSGMLLPEATSQKFWLDSAAWEIPDYDNADTFVERLVRDGLLVYEPVVEAVIGERPQAAMAPRTVRHRFLRATGLTHSKIQQIARAKRATALLENGVPILDAVDQAGYADQPHMTRSLRRYIGYTPAEIAQNLTPQPPVYQIERGSEMRLGEVAS
ncbi:MAG: AraC family transcriptional regulator [Chloroflexota bacterium]